MSWTNIHYTVFYTRLGDENAYKSYQKGLDVLGVQENETMRKR